jgi:hypothetical protein
MKRLSLVLAILVAAGCDAMGCQNLGHMRSIFYQLSDLKDFNDADFIAEITIQSAGGATSDGRQLSIAKVNRVIKGETEDTISVVSDINDCQNFISVGDHGIVMGKLRKKSQGDVELIANSDSRFSKALRRRSDRNK